MNFNVKPAERQKKKMYHVLTIKNQFKIRFDGGPDWKDIKNRLIVCEEGGGLSFYGTATNNYAKCKYSDGTIRDAIYMQQQIEQLVLKSCLDFQEKLLYFFYAYLFHNLLNQNRSFTAYGKLQKLSLSSL